MDILKDKWENYVEQLKDLKNDVNYDEKIDYIGMNHMDVYIKHYNDYVEFTNNNQVGYDKFNDFDVHTDDDAELTYMHYFPYQRPKSETSGTGGAFMSLIHYGKQDLFLMNGSENENESCES
jgi:hypothetical protein